MPQWNTNHNGGGLAFDDSGFLFLALGDGGGSGDNQDNAQDPTNLLGSVLRLEVLDSAPFYQAPDGNPFTGVGDDRRDEIFAYGFRNPWRLSVDAATGEIWVGDVGQSSWEEIDVVELGGNYGWDCREGAHDYDDLPSSPGSSSPACDQLDPGDFVDPVWEYPPTGSRLAVTGGYVYRGDA
ncbi:MAG: PQQ-dependent sugar dehydrogenase, partial [Longimicrobiales bacterium]